MAATAEDWLWINQQRLFFASPQTASWVDPSVLADAIGMICNLREFEAIGSDRHFLHRSGMAMIGDTAITSAAFLAQRGKTDDFNQCLIELPLSPGSGTSFRIDGKNYQCHGGVQGLFLPGQAMEATTEQPTCSLGFNLDPARLSTLLVTLSDHGISPEQARLDLQRPHSITLTDPRVLEIWTWLQNVLIMLETSTTMLEHPHGPLALALEELVYRASLLMIRPDLIQSASWNLRTAAHTSTGL